MKYFAKCNTAEELKSLYKEFAKKLHPDVGGDNAEFQKMQCEYEQRLNELLDKSAKLNKFDLSEYVSLVQALADLVKAKNPALHNKLGMLTIGASFIANSVPQVRENSQFQAIKQLIDNIKL